MAEKGGHWVKSASGGMTFMPGYGNRSKAGSAGSGSAGGGATPDAQVAEAMVAFRAAPLDQQAAMRVRLESSAIPAPYKAILRQQMDAAIPASVKSALADVRQIRADLGRVYPKGVRLTTGDRKRLGQKYGQLKQRERVAFAALQRLGIDQAYVERLADLWR